MGRTGNKQVMNISALQFLESSYLSGVSVLQSDRCVLKIMKVKQRDRSFTYLLFYILGKGGRNEGVSGIIFTPFQHLL